MNYDDDHTHYYSLVTLPIFLLDMYVKGTKMYYHKLQLVRNPKLVLFKYVKTWFIVDLLANIPLWLISPKYFMWLKLFRMCQLYHFLTVLGNSLSQAMLFVKPARKELVKNLVA